MKKFFSLLVCIAVLLFGCASGMQQKMAENATPEPVESQVQESSELLLPNPEEPQEESSSITLVPDFRASATTNTERICDTIDDTVLFTKQIQETSFLLPAVTETELQINTVLQERREESDAEAAKLSSLASDTYHTLLADDEMLNFYGYSYYTLDAITRLDCIASSMTTYFSSYTGGAHPNNVQEAFNFSLEDGDRLSLEEVLQPKGTRALEFMILERLQEKADGFGLFPEYESVVAERFQPDALCTQTDFWYFSNTGLVVFFNPYDISPYAAGVVKIEFPYEDLKGILKPEYFPAAADPAAKAAAPVLSFPANMNPEQYQTVEYVEAATNDSNVTFAMYGSDTVYNLSLSLVDWVEEQPFLRQSIYAANYLSDSNLVVIQADAAVERGNICMQYDSGNGITQSVYFGLAYEDGAYHWITE